MTSDSDATHPRPPGRPLWSACAGALGWFLVALYFLAAAAVLALQYAILPNIETYAPAIEQAISRSLGERVTIGHISARWQGLRAELDLSDLRVYDADGRLALQLPSVETVIGWRSIPLASLRLSSLTLDHPDLQIRRDAQGRIFIAGLQLHRDPSTPWSAAWLFTQPEIVIRDAQLTWDDELRAAPTLSLWGVNLVLQNRPFVHRFSLRANTAPELASALDLRGELKGDPPPDLLDWNGRLYAQVDYADLAVWQRWIDYPLAVDSGRGALRLWMSFGGGRFTEATADMAMADVHAQITPDLPLLKLDHLEGRLSGKEAQGTIQVTGRRLTVQTSGAALTPADFDLRLERASEDRPAKGDLQVSEIDLEALARLAEFLPFSERARSRVTQIDPKGVVRALKLSWTGDWTEAGRYSIRGRFSGLSVKNLGEWGGFSGANGNLDASQAGGNLRLESSNVTLDVPAILPEKRAKLDSLVADVRWSVRPQHVEVKFENIALANRDLTGTLHGAYTMRNGHGPGTLDLNGSFARIDARAAYRYIPLLPDAVANYLKTAVDGGQLIDARLRLKGDLRNFPYADGKSGVFDFAAKLSNAEFEFASDWPKLTGINGELTFEGARMQVQVLRAGMMRARLNNVRAQIADLYNGDELLRVEGEAEAPTPEFLRFIDASPVAGYIAGQTHSMVGTGPGRLQLRLELPLRRLERTKVTGQYQFSNNQFVFDPDLPPLTQLNGRLDFSENSLSGRNLSAQFFGGPVTFSIQARGGDEVSVSAQGTASMAALQKVFDSVWLQRSSGSAAWSGQVAMGPGRFDLQLDSPLAGVAIALPEPFGKAPGEVFPLRVRRTNRIEADVLKRARVAQLPEKGDAIALSLGVPGRSADGLFIRRRSGEDYLIQRGALGINEPAPALEASGVVVSATLANLDVDRWRGLLGSEKGEGGEGVNNLKLNVSALDVAGKRFNDVRLRATPGGDGWNASVTAREMEGTLTWQPDGRGRIVARLKRFTVPDSLGDAPPQDSAGGELPALDIAAEEFVLRDKRLGRLELNAVNEARDWRIEKLVLSSGDGVLSASGLWQSWASKPSVALTVKVDARDSGRLLARLGYPETVKAGTATLEGKLSWVGSPHTIDYPSLTGEVRLNAGKGQFLRADPGIAKLLGILSLQSWITLDFREFLGEGFAFETISSNARIAKGILSTDDFAMSGKAAQVFMSGTVDLARETQNLKARVVPSVGGSFSSVLAILANPVWGLGSLVLQKALKDPLGRIFTFEYSVTGTWDAPKVEALRAEAIQVLNPSQ